MDSGGGAWPKDLQKELQKMVEDTAQQLGLPTLPSDLTLHNLLGIDPAAASALREYLAVAYGNDPKSAALFPSAREDVELTEPLGSLKHTLRESPRAGDAAAHVPWAQDEDIHKRLYELLSETATPVKGKGGPAAAPPEQQQGTAAAAGAGGRVS